MPGYHLYEIKKGTLGEFSKVVEEFEEFTDAIEQDCSIMAILELSDLVGSVKYYYYEKNRKPQWDSLIASLYNMDNAPLLVDHHDLTENFKFCSNPNYSSHWSRLNYFIMAVHQFVHQYNLTIRDLIRMSNVTERAFLSGQRT